ncbi:glycosyltransferase [Vibrio panuliri]|uniref:Glycosyl transferase family 1 domain-containing protein n=1 Tax=Vibrio panuliri TaxID=1381081 RepID=A0ABX3FBY2_9VIBR|nr:glycosyltransferase [Vibrio panuliri]OLQ89296.1 hypothetical protein BIY20_11830 [Vibrio panuliri]
MTRQHNIIFDPIAFKGGSKIATAEALSLCEPSKVHFTVITCDREFWQQSALAKVHRVKIVKLPAIPWLREQVHGPLFWLNQVYFTIMLLGCTLLFGRPHRLIGASGPGVDMPVYLLTWVLKCSVIQLIHGNVACSRSIGWCLTRAERVFYLASTKQSLLDSLARYYQHKSNSEDSEAQAKSELGKPHFERFVNGITDENWPSLSHAEEARCLWAASLLRWKGLERFITALRLVHRHQPIYSTICYIKPKQIKLGVSNAPVDIPLTDWYHDPYNFDQLRSHCSIFVSTSDNEPFGLSILEALAAGMCVVIPNDNSYWDQHLSHGVDCIKYQTGDEASLANALLLLQQNPLTLASIRAQSLLRAEHYHAADRYREIIAAVSTPQWIKSADLFNVDGVKKGL